MRASFRTVVLVTVVGLPFFATGVTASASANDLKQRDKVESYAAALKVEHHARSPQDPNAFTSYDYGYTYPPPPSPTSYGDQPPSTVISSANSDYASSTEVGSVASDSSTYGVSDSVTLSLTTSAGVTATLSNAVTYSPSSDGTSRTVSSKVASTIVSLNSSSSIAPSVSSSFVTESTLWPPANTSTRTATSLSDSHTASSETISGTLASASEVNNGTAVSSTGLASAISTPSPPFSAFNSSSQIQTATGGPVSVSFNTSASITSLFISSGQASTLTQPVESPWPTLWNSTGFSTSETISQTHSPNSSSLRTSSTGIVLPSVVTLSANGTVRLTTLSHTLQATIGWNSTQSGAPVTGSQTPLGTGVSTSVSISSQVSGTLPVNSSTVGGHVNGTISNSPTGNWTSHPVITVILPTSTVVISGTGSVIRTSIAVTAAPWYPANSTIWPSGTLGSISEESPPPVPSGTGTFPSAANSSSATGPYPASNTTTLILPTGSVTSRVSGTPTTISANGTDFTAPWNSSMTGTLTRGSTAGTVVITSIGNATSITATIATPPQLPNSTWAASANATWMATSHSGNAATSNRTSIGASATLPPWPTFNSTQASLTGTISIPVITSSTTVISNITASASASFPWTNSTSSGGLTASVMTASGGSTITLWPTGMTPSLTSSSNGTLLQTSTANATSSLTSSAASAPFPTYNSTQIPWPTAVNSSGMPPSTVYSGTAAITYTSIGSDRPPFPTTNSTKLPGPTGSGTWASGTLFQTSEPSETSNSTSFTVNLPPFPTTGNATAIPRPTWIPGTASGLPVTTLTATGANGSTTQTLSIVPLPPFLTFNDTATPGATGTSAGTGVSVTWGGTGGPFSAPTDSSSTWGQWPNSTASNMLSTISVPTTPSGTAPLPTPRNTTTVTKSNGTAFSTGSPPITTGNPSSLPPFGNSTTISGAISTSHFTWTMSGTAFSSVSILPVPTLSPFNSSSSRVSSGTAPPSGSSLTESAGPAFTNSPGLPSGTPSACNTVTVTNGTVTQVVTTSILITSATAKADPTVVYPPFSSNNTAYTAYPPRSSCSSRWQNITIASSAGSTSSWTSSARTNRTWTSVDPTTTFITSTTSRLSNPSRDSSAIFNTSFSVAGTPTTTISNVPLPSSPAYPWGGLGPIFRHHSGTDPIDDDAGFPDGPVVQERNEVWWSRWKKHMDQLASRARARNRGA
ncbi:hypothetical protein JMJ77_0009951 [Colletotrichum scovillei]|uniref:Uncharacterized protein n=1 Tax=Colletotrichum scovillei TaxID=1209932 RepID=A0A9P7QQQ5_9PEZI|nr:hypothetical protein JMJ78_0001023 [Colletotrichum scovillei]KAG7040847.1 hypothetical protein JMJ77_0009951 [Colletotrichum scovillei]KAG7060891.1 hypothetical protein JMJ76_0009964 [Colletotrichum scovillei]